MKKMNLRGTVSQPLPLDVSQLAEDMIVVDRGTGEQAQIVAVLRSKITFRTATGQYSMLLPDFVKRFAAVPEEFVRRFGDVSGPTYEECRFSGLQECEQETPTAAIDYDAIDVECRDLVRFFNEHGLRTWMSCQGHGTVVHNLFYITFDETVTAGDIAKFQKQYLDSDGHFCSYGRFAKRFQLLRKWEDDTPTDKILPFEPFEYVAGSVEAAKADLRTWVRMDRDRRA